MFGIPWFVAPPVPVLRICGLDTRSLCSTPTRRAEVGQDTGRTSRLALGAHVLRVGVQQRVVLVEERRVVRQMPLEQRLVRVVAPQAVARQHPVDDPLGVHVHHERRQAGGVEHDIVRRLRSDPVHGQQLGAQRLRLHGAPPVHAIAVAPQELRHCLQLARLGVEVAAGADYLGQRVRRYRAQRRRRHRVRRSEVRDGAGRVRPRRVLREYRADDGLERAVARPPALRAVVSEQAVVHRREQPRGACGAAHVSRGRSCHAPDATSRHLLVHSML